MWIMTDNVEQNGKSGFRFPESLAEVGGDAFRGPSQDSGLISRQMFPVTFGSRFTE